MFKWPRCPVAIAKFSRSTSILLSMDDHVIALYRMSGSDINVRVTTFSTCVLFWQRSLPLQILSWCGHDNVSDMAGSTSPGMGLGRRSSRDNCSCYGKGQALQEHGVSFKGTDRITTVTTWFPFHTMWRQFRPFVCLRNCSAGLAFVTWDQAASESGGHKKSPAFLQQWAWKVMG